MEILQRKRQVNTTHYHFSFIKQQYHFFEKLKKKLGDPNLGVKLRSLSFSQDWVIFFV